MGLLFATTAGAALKIEITQGIEGAVPVAVVPFKWSGPTPRPPQDVSAIISSNLARSGRFDPLPVKDMLARPDSESDIHFPNWLLIGSLKIVVLKKMIYYFCVN